MAAGALTSREKVGLARAGVWVTVVVMSDFDVLQVWKIPFDSGRRTLEKQKSRLDKHSVTLKTWRQYLIVSFFRRNRGVELGSEKIPLRSAQEVPPCLFPSGSIQPTDLNNAKKAGTRIVRSIYVQKSKSMGFLIPCGDYESFVRGFQKTARKSVWSAKKQHLD